MLHDENGEKSIAQNNVAGLQHKVAVKEGIQLALSVIPSMVAPGWSKRSYIVGCKTGNSVTPS